MLYNHFPQTTYLLKYRNVFKCGGMIVPLPRGKLLTQEIYESKENVYCWIFM